MQDTEVKKGPAESQLIGCQLISMSYQPPSNHSHLPTADGLFNLVSNTAASPRCFILNPPGPTSEDAESRQDFRAELSTPNFIPFVGINGLIYDIYHLTSCSES